MKKRTFLLKTICDSDGKIKYLDRNYLSRWMVLLLDMSICAFSLVFSYLLLIDTPLNVQKVWSFPEIALFFIVVNTCFFSIFKTYSGIIRHSTFEDIVRFSASSVFTAVTAVVFNFIYWILTGQKVFLTTFLVLYMFFSFTLMLFLRVAVKQTFQYLRDLNAGSQKQRFMIFGIDPQTVLLGKALTTDADLSFKLVGFLTEKPLGKSLNIFGKPVFSLPITKESVAFTELIIKYKLHGVLLVRESLSMAETNQIVDACLSNNIVVLNVPRLEHLNKKLDLSTQIRPIEIEDLLEREPIKIDNEIIKNDLCGKTVLVTGGAGSIGSEIVKQLATFNPKKVVILDNAESALHEIELYLTNYFPNLNFSTMLADIRNIDRLEMIFAEFKFDFIYHAAAYKHVPLIERNPHEAVDVNIKGTINLADLAVQHGINKFVLISTDKAVNPTNVMGASKRAAEMYVQSLQDQIGTHTRFITTRFGNVLDSNGSVIPYFRKQIARGGPVTVTHKDIIRYFMTISEACQLVLQAGTMGIGGEIYVFDMGKPIRILDMAEHMIHLSGFKPYKDIDIEIIGLRPGEKLYEELLNDEALTLPTYHPKIMVSKMSNSSFYEVNIKIQNILAAAQQTNQKIVVKKLKELVPEYLSQNSEFEALDV